MQKQPILLNTFGKVFSMSFSTRSRRVIELDVSNTILFQIKFFGQKIKRTMLAMDLLKVTFFITVIKCGNRKYSIKIPFYLFFS